MRVAAIDSERVPLPIEMGNSKKKEIISSDSRDQLKNGDNSSFAIRNNENQAASNLYGLAYDRTDDERPYKGAGAFTRKKSYLDDFARRKNKRVDVDMESSSKMPADNRFNGGVNLPMQQQILSTPADYKPYNRNGRNKD